MVNLPTVNQLRPYAIPALVAFVSATAGFLASGSFDGSDEIQAQTEREQARLERLEARAAQLRTRVGSSAVICDLDPTTAETALEGRMGDAATRSGLAWQATTFQADPHQQYAVVTFRSRIEGSYESVVQSLTNLTRAGPTIFVERLDVQAVRAGVGLEIEGSVLCSTPSR